VRFVNQNACPDAGMQKLHDLQRWAPSHLQPWFLLLLTATLAWPDQGAPYCASPSNDEYSCGTCQSDLKQCETGALCTAGVCSSTCDKPGYLGENAGECRKSSMYIQSF